MFQHTLIISTSIFYLYIIILIKSIPDFICHLYRCDAKYSQTEKLSIKALELSAAAMKCVKTVVKDSCSAHFSANVEGNDVDVDIALTAKIDSESIVPLNQEHHQVLRPYQEEPSLQEPLLQEQSLQEQSQQEPFLHLHFHTLFQVYLKNGTAKFHGFFFES